MIRIKQIAAIGLLCIGTSGLSFGEIFQPVDSTTWNATYNSGMALFGAVIQQGGSSLQSGFPTGSGTSGAAFTNDVQEAFTLLYDPSSGLASLTVGSDTISGVQTLTVAPAGGTLDHIGIALSTGASDEAITISNIVLNGAHDTGNVLSATGSALLDFAMTPSAGLAGQAFSLSGDINMSWTGNAPGSQMSAEIVGADVAALPEPGTWMMLGSGLAALGFLRRKR
jgi:hypothetical protein